MRRGQLERGKAHGLGPHNTGTSHLRRPKKSGDAMPALAPPAAASDDGVNELWVAVHANTRTSTQARMRRRVQLPGVTTQGGVFHHCFLSFLSLPPPPPHHSNPPHFRNRPALHRERTNGREYGHARCSRATSGAPVRPAGASGGLRRADAAALVHGGAAAGARAALPVELPAAQCRHVDTADRTTPGHYFQAQHAAASSPACLSAVGGMLA